MSPNPVKAGPECRLADPQMVARVLQTRGIVPTAQRVRIGALIFGSSQHLTADQVIDRLRDCGTPVSKATVYNTLNLFASNGLLRQINVDSERACFDSNTGEHYHFHNIDTGELIDVPVPEVRFERLPPLPPGTELTGVEIVLRVRSKSS